LEGVYTDRGVAPRGEPLRGLISLPIRDEPGLVRTIQELYDPTSPRFRQYLSADELHQRHAPPEDDVRVVTDWLVSKGFKVGAVATNRLLIHFTGTVGQFNDAFGVTVRILERKAPQAGNPPHDVFGLTETITVPKHIEDRILALASLDLDDDAHDTVPPENDTPAVAPPNVEDGYTPQQIAAGYGVKPLWEQGFRGGGIKVGVVVGGTFHLKDTRAFWRTWGIDREDPTVVSILGPARYRIREANLDVQWAGALAPEADLVVYSAPDARNTSMLFNYNEAIARNEVSVITNSFAHREDSEPRAVRRQYSASSMMGAALGITLAAASGDSAGVDVPASSPWVTAVGGTLLGLIGERVVWETAWSHSGSGPSLTLDVPEWQKGLKGVGDKRATVDLALNSGMGYWYLWLGRWYSNIGTSFASPVFAGLVAVVNDAREDQGKPRIGFLNSLLYTRPDIQRTFRDVTEGHTVDKHGNLKYRAGPGWDMVTGWGAPDAQGLLRTLP
ncbi:protease pro-enzyme activation domain-containing protein, partial [Pyxidicoccus sp. 3LFB2]